VGTKARDLDIPVKIVQYAEFQTIDQLASAMNILDYSIEGKQLSAGDMTTTIALATCGTTQLLRQTSNRCVETIGNYSKQCITLIMPKYGTSLLHNGYTLQDTHMLMADVGAEIYASNPHTKEVMNILIPKQQFMQTIENLMPKFDISLRKYLLLSFTRDFAMQIRRLINLCTQSEQSPFVQRENEANLMSGIALALNYQQAQKNDHAEIKRQAKYRLLMKARGYINQHITEPITMAGVCLHTGTSLSSIERVFRVLLQMTPSQYIVAQRLNGVRAGVLTQPAVSISDLALQHGFNHLGRFSSAYKSQFGCLPSEERSYVE